jgi:uncharacterized repeat protein (TIGR02543 family)
MSNPSTTGRKSAARALTLTAAALFLAFGVSLAGAGRAHAQQTMTGVATGAITVVLDQSSDGNSSDGSGNDNDGGSASDNAGSASGLASTGDGMAFAVLGAGFLVLGAAYVLLRSRKAAPAHAAGRAGSNAPAGAGKDVVVVGAVAALAAAACLGLSLYQASAWADEQTDTTGNQSKVTVDGTIVINEQGEVVSSDIDLDNLSEQDLTIIGFLCICGFDDLGDLITLSDSSAEVDASMDYLIDADYSDLLVFDDFLQQVKDAGSDGIEAPVSLVYTYTAYDIKFDSNGGSAVNAMTVAQDSAIGDLPTPVREGYTFDGWCIEEESAADTEATAETNIATAAAEADTEALAETPTATAAAEANIAATGDKVTAETKVTQDVTLKANWVAATYKVEIYKQNEAGTGYGTPTTETVSGTAGKKTDYKAPACEGFTVKSFDQQTIAADGSTTLKVYYDRELYKLNYDLQGHGSAIDSTSVRYGALLFTGLSSAASNPKAEGWGFEGWYLDKECTKTVQWDTDTMGYYPDGLTVYAKWHEGTQYQVWCYTTKVIGWPTWTKTCYGTAGETVTAADDITGYTLNKAKSTKVSDTLAADGSTVLEVYYDTNSYNLTYHYMGKSSDQTVSVDYGYTPTWDSHSQPKYNCPGYSIVGWYKDEALTQPFDIYKEKMPDHEMDLYAKWAPNTDTKYTVNHYQQNVDDGYTLVETETLAGTTEKSTAVAGKEYKNFSSAQIYKAAADGSTTLQTFDAATDQATIAADGSTVVNLYYNRDAYYVRVYYGEDDIAAFDPYGHSQKIRNGRTASEPDVLAMAQSSDKGSVIGWKRLVISKVDGQDVGSYVDFNFSEPITAEMAAQSGGQIFIVAQWASLEDSYWLAPARSMTTSNSSVQVSNPNYKSPKEGIAKSRSQIQADVKKIAAGDAATIAEYTNYMKNDNYHLYTKIGSGTSDNDYAEFRIINVGSHDGDGSALTFQAVSALGESMMNFNRLTADGGWGATDLRTSMNSGDIYKRFASKFTSDIMPVAKTSLVSNTSWSFATSESTTFDKLWLPSYSEMFSDASATGETRDAHDAQYAYEGSQYAYYAQMGLKGSDRNAALRQLSGYRDGTSDSGKDATWLRTTKLSDTNRFARIDADGLGSYNGKPESSESYQHIMYAPCFSFGDTSAHTVKFETNGGSAVSEQSIANGSTVASATTTKSGSEFVGWYTDAELTKPFVLGSTVVTSDITLYARWVESESSVLDSYWLADSYRYTNGNSTTAVNQVKNSDCETHPYNHVVKNRAQILFDVSRIKAGDQAAKVEYTYYCLTDAVHLYSLKSGGNKDSANDYNEFRIVNVGSHNDDGSGLTLMSATAWRDSKSIDCSISQTRITFEYCFPNSALCNSSDISAEFGSKLNDDILSTNRQYANGWRYDNSLNVFYIDGGAATFKWFIATTSEIGGNASWDIGANSRETTEQLDAINSRGAQFQYFKYHGASNSNSSNGTIASMTYRRNGESVVSYVDGDSSYLYNCVLMTSTPTPRGAAYQNYQKANQSDFDVFIRYGANGAVDYENCKVYSGSSNKAAFAPAFCL